MTKATETAKAPSVPTPTTHDDCNSLVEQIGRYQRLIAQQRAQRDEKLARIKAQFDGNIARWEADCDALVDAVHVYCDEHRAELTDGGKKKTFRFAAGEVAWRNRPPSVTVRKVQAVIKFCLADKGLAKFLRTKHKVNKDALRDDPKTAATIPGVKIGSGGEDFFVEPFEPKATDKPAQAA